MKKRFLAALATGLLLIGTTSIAEATIINLAENYNPLFNYTAGGYKVLERGSAINLDTVKDSEAEIIGYMGTSFSGIYIGTVVEFPDDPKVNSPITEATMEMFISYFLRSSFDAELFLKAEDKNLWEKFVFDDEGFKVTLSVDLNTDEKSGEWKLTDENPMLDYAISFYGVKAAQEWSLYFVDPAATSGKWTTGHLLTPNEKNVPEISHFAGVAGSTPVPEPATMLLFGTGLAGLAAVARRRKN